ncbi:MAG: NAD(P)/FAD-dependent oxidoreductase [Planctomycetes bacterium]|nr:NAD(P)/FAD-dependent oxidoreductase [Planctomycetota bacterium]MCH9726721.1 NAD(P)/FAD-dependent oxidoreductase [Planctomycetota bacterium]MCH9779629.1 NAD(P)/FAD-dependent oxidoreductase [Planctomycetota bacterium]MCH9791010.1 NAD(P)/FAD-dependent oxidoreductase [Planctomycetota bacterium]MDF1745688.1 NAD(P)/FAD-dependent oxidoreductase [Gimesia sp.]
MSYDSIIIGAGLSGLAAGIRLAYYGKRVCILERHTTIGGLNSFYRLRGRNHDVGLHAVTNYSPPGGKRGPLNKILRQLRFQWEDFDLSPQCGSSVVFPGHTLRFNNQFDYFQAQIAEQFPQQIDGFRQLVTEIDAHNIGDLGQQWISTRERMAERISDPLLINMLLCPLMFYGSPSAHDMDFNQFVIMFRSIYQEGFARPYQGVRLILKNLTKKFKALGGELKLRAGVKQLLIEGKKVSGVVLDDGSILESQNVLSSAGSAETLQMCDVDVPRDDRFTPGDISFVETISVLDQQPAEFGHDETIVFYNDSEDFYYEQSKEPVDLRSGIICSPNNFKYDQPLKEGSIRITALANPDYWMSLPEEKYIEEKQYWYEEILKSSMRFIPDFRPHVLDIDTFTPRTIKKFTGHINGCVYGAPQKILDGTTPFNNLFLCGTDQGFLGIIGSMLSGISIANLHLLNPK